MITGLKFFLLRKGPLTVGASYLCGFIKSDSHLESPNLQFLVLPDPAPATIRQGPSKLITDFL